MTSDKKTEELNVANTKNAFENSERAKLEKNLIIAYRELAFLNEEMGKRAAELEIANIELIFQNAEKEKRAAELLIANEELASQNKEKEKRACELEIANIELILQNEEKEKRADELIIANKELLLQNEEKIDRTEQLEAANKELEAFSYSVSHDLRAPLRAVNGYAQMLAEDYDSQLDSEGKRIIQTIRSNASRMGKLIDDLLAFSRLGRAGIEMTVIDLPGLVAGVLNEVNKSITHSAEIRVGTLHSLRADYSLISQVVFNLVSNAIKYSSKREHPVVEIFSKEKDGAIVFSVKDNGVGFDMIYYNKLFGVFQRLHSAEEFEGTGVGLAIVQRIIYKHGGKVWAESKVDEGSVFSFKVPNS